MKNHCPIKDFKLDIKKEFIYIYINESESLSPSTKNYETLMRFKLIDKENRTFEVERFCFLGSVDDWIYLDSSEDLKELAQNYVCHLGQESLYELFD